MQLRRAQLVLMLVALLPTVLLIGIGIILLVLGNSTTSRMMPIPIKIGRAHV